MSDPVLDASALLAWLNREPGSGAVAAALATGAAMSSVNLSEVVAKLADVGGMESDIRDVLTPLGLDIHPFDVDSGYDAGMMRSSTRDFGLSLGDRACLALGASTGNEILTADRRWADLDADSVGAVVTVIR